MTIPRVQREATSEPSAQEPSEIPAQIPVQSLAKPSDRSDNKFAASDIELILREHGWLDASSAAATSSESDRSLQNWLIRAADTLGPRRIQRLSDSQGDHVSDGYDDRSVVTEVLSLIFHYDAAACMQQAESQSVMSREGAREVIREIANRVFEGGDVDSDRLNEIVEAIKKATPYRSREIFHPLRLALAGRSGEGNLDRLILLIDPAAKLEFAEPVKNCRQRILEFCAALD